MSEQVARQPELPRASGWFSLASFMYRAREERFIVLFGVFAVAVTLYCLLAIDDKTWWFVVMQISGLVFGVVCIATPGLYAQRVNRAITHGSLATATVLESRSEGGYVEGRLRVDHVRGSFVADFSEEGHFAGALKPASTVTVLIDERRSKLLFVIGGAVRGDPHVSARR